MSRTERISGRLPRFYRNWDRTSLVSAFIESVCEQLDEAEQGITKLLEAHWVSTANGKDLDKIGSLVRASRMSQEGDERFRGRLKSTVDEYKGGGTVSVILDEMRRLVGAKPGEVEIEENPESEVAADFGVVANSTWTLGSSSIEDEQTRLFLVVEEEGEVINPQIINMDTGQSVTYEGILKTGEQLFIGQNKVLLNEKNVAEKVKMHGPLRLLRRGSVWKYSESLLEKIGMFDTGKFDDQIFAVDIPTVRVRFEWKRREPAAFLVKIKAEALFRSGLVESDVEKMLNSRKAVGIKGIVKVME